MSISGDLSSGIVGDDSSNLHSALSRPPLIWQEGQSVPIPIIDFVIQNVPNLNVVRVDQDESKYQNNLTECLICRQSDGIVMMTTCAHGPYHEICLRGWLNIQARCPLCRGEVHMDDLPVFGPQMEPQPFVEGTEEYGPPIDPRWVSISDSEFNGPNQPDWGSDDLVLPRGRGMFENVDRQYIVHGEPPGYAPVSGRELRVLTFCNRRLYKLPTLISVGYLRQQVVYDWYNDNIGPVVRGNDFLVPLPAVIIEDLKAWCLYRPHVNETFKLLVARTREMLRVVAVTPEEHFHVIKFAPIVVWYEVMAPDVQELHRLAVGAYGGIWNEIGSFALKFGSWVGHSYLDHIEEFFRLNA